MERITSNLEKLKKINKYYDISTKYIEQLHSKMGNIKVCTPIIGKFSTGKSALVNTLLGYSRRILKEDITPETAVPVEITYTDAEDSISIIRNDGSCKKISVDEYRNYQADANTVKCTRIQLRNSFLEEIPDVMLVDMPGFESGFEIHNKAIDNYLPQSLAYIVAFPADDMIIRSSIGNILKELCLHDMPLCIVITKYDKKNDEFDETFENMKENLKKFIGDRKVKYCLTSSFTGDAEELEEFLREIQEKSQEILSNSLVNSVLAIAENTENYLKTILNNSELSESELSEQEEKLEKQLSELDSKFSSEQENFNSEISECVEEIKNDVKCAMEAEEAKLVAMVMNNQSINEHLNNVVRNAVIVSIKKRFVPKVEKYLKRVANCINSESIGDIHISFNFDFEQINKGITASIVAAVAGILIGLPILGIIAGIIMKLRNDKKREEVKQEIRMKLRNEVFPQVMREISSEIETAITKQVNLVNDSINDEINTRRKTLEKAISDVRSKISDEKADKEKLVSDIKADLESIQEIKMNLGVA